MRAIVVEDEPIARRFLVELLEESGRVQVVAAVGTLEEALETLAPEAGLVADVAFVDIQLASVGEAGLGLVRRLSMRDEAPACVLVTAHAQHAVEAYDLGVADYLLKPVTAGRVLQCLDRLAVPATSEAVPRVVARSRRGLVFFDVEEVLAFQAEDRLVYVHAHGERFDLDRTLSGVERTFGDRFLRVHRNWLVNRGQVTQLERDGGDVRLLVGSLEVPVARDRAAAIRRELLAGAFGIKGAG